MSSNLILISCTSLIVIAIESVKVYNFSTNLLLQSNLTKDYVGSLYYLNLQSVRQCLNQIFHQLGRIG